MIVSLTHLNSANQYTAELFASIFLSFEPGIANAISSFKWRKIYILYEK